MAPATSWQARLQQYTPVERRGAYYFKRDDLFVPFEVPLNGGKVRQALQLFATHAERIKKDHHGTVCTVSSVHSPQGYLIARCAAEFGLRTMIGVGSSRPDSVVDRFPALRRAVALGAEIISLASIGYNSVLQGRLDKLAARNQWFPVAFGIGMDNGVNARQVHNLPGDVVNLVIPCGSGMSARSILQGVGKLPKRPTAIYIVQIAGIDRRKVLPSWLPYHFVADDTHPYARKIACEYEGLELDQIYESKAFAWLQRNPLAGKTCFWVIGNFNQLR